MKPMLTQPHEYFAVRAAELAADDYWLPAVVGFVRLLGHADTTDGEVDTVLGELEPLELAQALGFFLQERVGLTEANMPNMALIMRAFTIVIEEELRRRRFAA